MLTPDAPRDRTRGAAARALTIERRQQRAAKYRPTTIATLTTWTDVRPRTESSHR